MSLLIYNLFLKLYRLGVTLVARKGNKAQRWLDGREGIFDKIQKTLSNSNEKRIWVHCASLGEFEQGRPLIEEIKRSSLNDLNYKIVLTFFSPSGYEIRKDYEYADYVFYLPLDGKRSAKRFIELVNPSLALFVKYEFWYYYLEALHRRNVPSFLVSAKFRSSQPFFKWYGGLFRKMLSYYTWLFVQDEKSKELLKSINVAGNVTIAGDTRYDRVATIAAQARIFPMIERWKGASRIIVAGSTWGEDEKLLGGILQQLPANWKYIIAPHEIHEAHLKEIEYRFSGNIVRYSQLSEQEHNARVLIIDNIGMLSSLYQYADIAYVGGGFGKGIHNILEATAFGAPVLFGPRYEKFAEAVEMVAQKFAFPVSNPEDLEIQLQRLYAEDNRKNLRVEILQHMQMRQGATSTIMRQINKVILGDADMTL